MENNLQNTKQKIQQTALELFSKKGYHSVSIRDICKVVGIKESTVYYHFKNKKDILDSLYEQVERLMNDMKNLFNNAFSKIKVVDVNAFCKVAVGFLENYLLEPIIYQLIGMLTIEKLTDQLADQKYRELLFYAPLHQQEKVFTLMIGKKYFKQADALLLANEYYSIIFYIFQKYFCGYEVTDNCRKQAKNELTIHMARFFYENNNNGVN